MSTEQQGVTRRQALGSGAAAVSALAMGPRPVNPTVRVGLVGCGGRGTGAVGSILQGREDVELTAMGDLFQSQIDERLGALREYKTRDKQPLKGINVKPENCFTGYEAYKRVIDSDIDVVLLVTPPYARPEHFEYAVKAGKNIFVEKPCATDAAGINRMMALEDEINRKGLNVVAGFERRHLPFMKECRQRLQDGAIGEMTTGYAYFNTNSIWYREPKPGMSDKDFWFYNWYHVDWMSGDHIVEQAVHSPDIINWIFDEVPVRAYGMGGRQYHTERGGNIYDHFAVEYEYPDGTRMTSMCRQIVDTDTRIGEFIVGDKGTVTMLGGHDVNITGPNAAVLEEYPEQNESHMQEHRDFITDLRKGKIANDTRILCEGSMTAILGREAAYTGKVITWDDMMKSNMKLTPDDIAKWDGSLRPVPKPGMKRG